MRRNDCKGCGCLAVTHTSNLAPKTCSSLFVGALLTLIPILTAFVANETTVRKAKPNEHSAFVSRHSSSLRARNSQLGFNRVACVQRRVFAVVDAYDSLPVDDPINDVTVERTREQSRHRARSTKTAALVDDEAKATSTVLCSADPRARKLRSARSSPTVGADGEGVQMLPQPTLATVKANDEPITVSKKRRSHAVAEQYNLYSQQL
jgi:hypothetical protein